MNLDTVLTPIQRAVADRVLAEEENGRRHVVIALSGAHAYGFPSPDSDLDLKAVHSEPTAKLLGLSAVKPTADRMEVLDGVEIDYTSNELQMVLNGILVGNGNYAERILGRLPIRTSPEHESLAPLVRRAMSRRMHRHYHGFATGQLRELEKSPAPTAKRVLYVLRTALTGTHLLRSGALVADLSELAGDYGFGEALALIERKRAGERTPLSPAEAASWRGAITRAFEALDAALEGSCLPADPPNAAELESWLLDLRRARF